MKTEAETITTSRSFPLSTGEENPDQRRKIVTRRWPKAFPQGFSLLHNPLVQSLEAVAAFREFSCIAGIQARHPGVRTCSFSFSVRHDDNQLSIHCTLLGGSCCPMPSSPIAAVHTLWCTSALIQVSVPCNQSPNPMKPTLCSAPPPSPK